MPYSLLGQTVPEVNVRIGLREVSTPERLVETLNLLQDEVNRQNKAVIELLIVSLGTCAYTDGAGV